MSDTQLETFKIDSDFLVRYGGQIYSGAKSGHTILMEAIREDQMQYDGEFSAEERKNSEYLGIPRLYINKTYNSVQRILVDVIDTIYPDPDEIISVASDKLTPLDFREATKVLLNWRLNSHPIDFYKELYESGLDALRNKYAVMKVYPNVRTKMVKQTRMAEAAEGETPSEDNAIEEEKEVVDAYEPQMVTLPPDAVLFGKGATWKNYHQFPVVHVYRRTRDYLIRNGYDKAAVLDAPKAGAITTGSPLETKRDEKYGQNVGIQNEITLAEEVIVQEFWCALPDDTGHLESGYFCLLGGTGTGGSLVGKGWEPNRLPYKFSEFELNRHPFILGLALPESHQLEGKSFPQITRSNQKEINAIANQTREAFARDIRPMVYVNEDTQVNVMDLANRRIGGFVRGRGPASEAITTIQGGNASLVGLQQRNRVDQDYFEAGIPPNLFGTGDQGTATGDTQQLQNANKKVQQIIKNLAFTLYLPAFQRLLRLEQTYISPALIEEVTGRAMGKLIFSPTGNAADIIQGEFDLKVNVAVNKQAQSNLLLLLADRVNQTNQAIAQLVQMGVANPAQVQFYNPDALMDELFRLRGFKNVKEMKVQALPPPPEQGAAPGIASQPRNVMDPAQQISNMAPSASGPANVLG